MKKVLKRLCELQKKDCFYWLGRPYIILKSDSSGIYFKSYYEENYSNCNGFSFGPKCQMIVEFYKPCAKRINKKPAVQLDMRGYQIGEFSSIREAANVLNIHESTIGKNLKLKRKTAGGFRFKYKAPETIKDLKAA